MCRKLVVKQAEGSCNVQKIQEKAVVMYSTWWPKALLGIALCQFGAEEATLAPSWQWEISGITSHAQTTTPEELKGRKPPEKSDGSKTQALGCWGAGSGEGGEAREWASLAWLMQRVAAEHGEIIAGKWQGWDTAGECCAWRWRWMQNTLESQAVFIALLSEKHQVVWHCSL